MLFVWKPVVARGLRHVFDQNTGHVLELLLINTLLFTILVSHYFFTMQGIGHPNSTILGSRVKLSEAPKLLTCKCSPNIQGVSTLQAIKAWPKSFQETDATSRMDNEHSAELWAVWCSPVSLAASPDTGQSRDLSGTLSNPPKQGNPPQYSPETFLLEITNNSPPPLQRSSPPPSYVCLNRTPCGPWWTLEMLTSFV